MEGSKIGTLNSAIEDVIPEIRQISAENADAQIKIAVLEFSEGAKWLTPAPMDVADYSWNFLNADGITDFGAACKELNAKLSRDAFMGDVTGSFAPAIFLLSDGEPTDEYKSALATLKNNNWFKKAIKAAVGSPSESRKIAGAKEPVTSPMKASLDSLALSSLQAAPKSVMPSALRKFHE
jgi:uncharacterized protein YegL